MFTAEVTVACSPKSAAQKLVSFNVMNQDNPGDSPQCPKNFVSFLNWPEGAADECCDAWGLPIPVAPCPMAKPKMTMPKRESDQQCSTAAKEATPRSGTTPSAGMEL